MEKAFRILTINPGSTSTKVAAFENENKLFEVNVQHSLADMGKASNVLGQVELRKTDIAKTFKDHGIRFEEVDAIAVRGGPRKGHVTAGAYEVSQTMYDACRDPAEAHHPSRLGPIIAYEWTKEYPGLKAYNYDTVFSDELSELAKLSGTPLCERPSAYHALNTKAVARAVAKKYGEDYFSVDYIMVMLGGGVSVSLHSKGKTIDMVAEDEGSFSAVRAGRVPRDFILNLCFSGKYDRSGVKRLLDRESGLGAYLGTNDFVEIEKRCDTGDEKAKLLFDAFAYQMAKDIGSMAPVVDGKIDRIVLTGGIAYSQKFTEALAQKVRFIAPVEVFPGSIEQDALGLGILRVLRGEEEAHTYTIE